MRATNGYDPVLHHCAPMLDTMVRNVDKLQKTSKTTSKLPEALRVTGRVPTGMTTGPYHGLQTLPNA